MLAQMILCKLPHICQDTISKSIGQILFKRGDIRDFCNKPDEPMIVPEDGPFRQLTLWYNFSGQQ